MKKDAQILEKLFFRMSEEQDLQFLSNVFQSMNTYFVPNLPGVAGVSFDKKLKLFKLIIDPKKFGELKNDNERVAVLIHEIYHILHKHVFIPEEIVQARNKMQMNVALDLAINQHIKNLPEFAATIDRFRDKNKKPFPANQPWEKYYTLLEEAEVKKKQKGGGGEGDEEGKKDKWEPVDFGDEQMDEHGWADGEGDDKERLEATRDLIKRSMQKSTFGHSKVPDFVQDCLDVIEKEIQKLNYKQILLSALRQSLPSKDFEKTWKRPSRRYGDLAKGNISGKMPKLAVFIDTSGSISHEEANEFLKITNNFMTTGVSKATLYMFHTQKYYEEKIKKHFKVLPESFQSGGTDLQEPMDIIKKTKPDLAIILSDGYYDRPNVHKNMTRSVVFIISKGGNTNHPLKDIGKTVKYGD